MKKGMTEIWNFIAIHVFKKIPFSTCYKGLYFNLICFFKLFNAKHAIKLKKINFLHKTFILYGNDVSSYFTCISEATLSNIFSNENLNVLIDTFSQFYSSRE